MKSLLSLTALLLATPAFAGNPLEYDLTTNAPLAHVYRSGVVADAASPGFVKYTRDIRNKWKKKKSVDGHPAAYHPGIQANLWLRVGPELKGKKLAIEAMVRPAHKSPKMDAFLNGKKVGSPALKSGVWQIIRVDVDAAKVKQGINKVRLHYNKSVDVGGIKTASAIRYVRLVDASAAQPGTDAKAVSGALASTQGKAIVLPDGQGLDYYITPVKGQALTGSAQGGQVEVWAQTDGGAPSKLGSGASVNVNLNKFANKATRLMLRGAGGHVKFTGAIKGAKAGTAKVAKPKYVVFWLIDTLRADKLDFYPQKNANGRKKVKTPHLSKIAKEGVVFDPFYVEGTESKASHASLFTGTYPLTHKVYNHKAKLSTKHTTIAEAFKSAGYRTAGFISNGYVSDKWNYTQGFQTSVNFIREGKAHNAIAVVKKAKPWITKHKGKPFYLYLGTSDPHVTYRAHKEFIDQYSTKGYGGNYKKYISGKELGRLKGNKNPPSAKDRKRIEALYENEIAFNDKHFGDLIAHLKAEGIYDETLIIISADHGDEFWEHGGCGHGHNLHQELVRVPMVIRYPKAFPAGRSTAGADGVDLLPTLQALLGQTPPKDVQGRSLLPFVGAKNAYPQAVMAMNGRDSFTLAVGPAKAIMRSESSIKVYNIKKDIAEKTDLYGKKTVLTLAALDPLTLWLSRPKAWRRAKLGAPNNLISTLK
jgi:arylsulfatase A-like enzyme